HRRVRHGGAVPVGAARGDARPRADLRRRRAGADAGAARRRAGRGAVAAQSAGGLMREALAPRVLGYTSDAPTHRGTLGLIAWSWLAMRAAERRKDEGRRK